MADATAKPKRYRVRSDKDRERDRRRVRPARTCPICKRQYHPTCGDQKYCSRRCGGEAHRKSGLLLKPGRRKRWPASRIYVGDCTCGVAFVSRYPRGACSKRCADRDYNQTRRTDRNPLGVIHCEVCQAEVQARSASQKRCEDCARQRRRINGKHRRRARKFGVPYESINERAVFERDHWRCQLCRKPVATTKLVPHPKSPTIDCIVPLSVPGSPGFVLSNVQLAHFICNSLKNNGGEPEQLRLIG